MLPQQIPMTIQSRGKGNQAMQIPTAHTMSTWFMITEKKYFVQVLFANHHSSPWQMTFRHGSMSPLISTAKAGFPVPELRIPSKYQQKWSYKALLNSSILLNYSMIAWIKIPTSNWCSWRHTHATMLQKVKKTTGISVQIFGSNTTLRVFFSRTRRRAAHLYIKKILLWEVTGYQQNSSN
jgi:hypothetical protein